MNRNHHALEKRGIQTASEKFRLLITMTLASMSGNRVTEFTSDESGIYVGTRSNGSLLMCRAFVPHMKGTGYGRHFEPDLDHEPYLTAPPGSLFVEQGRVARNDEGLALELAPEGVTVNGSAQVPSRPR